MGLERFDIYSGNKTHDDLKVRTLSGAAISVAFSIIALLLLVSEFRTWRSLETVDVLDVDTTARPDGRLPVNVDLYLPSLPCGELITEVTDESGSQQLTVTDSLHKLRMDRNGVPIDTPERVEWGHVVAPAFQQRKVVHLMEDAHKQLRETLGHLDHESEENPGLTAAEHAAHRAQLAEQAAQLHGRLSQLTEVARAAELQAEGAEEAQLDMSARELHAMKEEVETSLLYTESQRSRVLTNLHAMAKNVARLQNDTTSAPTANNLREALRIRLSILSDNVHGFITAADIDRRDRYNAMQEMLNDVADQTALLPSLVAGHVNQTLTQLASLLSDLNGGLGGTQRAEVERTFERRMRELQAELRGDESLAADYCGSCYGATLDTKRCCNTCQALRDAYVERRWGFPDASNFEQCRREARTRSAKLQEGEGCNIYGTMQVARVTGTFSVAPISRLAAAKLQKAMPSLPPATVSAFNVTHRIGRLSFGTDFPGQHNPLDGVWQHSPSGAAVSRYFLKVVPTTYEFVGGKAVHTNQFSATSYFKPLSGEASASMVPCVSFVFELTPLKVKKTERRAGSFATFATRTAALIGGLFTVAGIVDSVLYQSARHMEKLNVGKQG